MLQGEVREMKRRFTATLRMLSTREHEVAREASLSLSMRRGEMVSPTPVAAAPSPYGRSVLAPTEAFGSAGIAPASNYTDHTLPRDADSGTGGGMDGTSPSPTRKSTRFEASAAVTPRSARHTFRAVTRSPGEESRGRSPLRSLGD